MLWLLCLDGKKTGASPILGLNSTDTHAHPYTQSHTRRQADRQTAR